MKNYFKKVLLFAACLLMVACSDDEEQGKLTLPSDQNTSMTLGANVYSAQVRFTAAGEWSARTSITPDGIDEVEWLHLNDYRGTAGEAYLNFQLDYNNTGAERTGYIIIICEDATIVVTVTQSSEDDPDELNPNIYGNVEIEVNRYAEMSGMGFYFDGTTHYSLTYESGYPVEMVSTWRDDMVSYPGAPEDHDSYCMNVQTTSFNWLGNTPESSTSIMANMRTEVTYYPSERTELEETSEHFAEKENGRVVNGWYRRSYDPVQTDWKLTYDKEGRLAKSENNDASPEWLTYTFTWKNGNISRISGSDNYTITITYADPKLANLHQSFDINWILPTELECYDFSAGDITRIFASIGLLGKSSQLLMTEITESDGNTTRSYRMDYKENTKNKTVVTVQNFVNNVQTSYSDWTITYSNIK